MNAKLHININEGMLSVEGDEKFVQTIYSDFRQRLIEKIGNNQNFQHQIDATPTKSITVLTHKQAPKTAKSSSNNSLKMGSYKPEANPNLNLAELPKFYAQFSPKHLGEKLLIFAVFIRDKVKKGSCTADDIFSCFFALKNQIKIPEAFPQAFKDSWKRDKWVHFVSKDEITITTAGENHFTEMSKAKPAE